MSVFFYSIIYPYDIWTEAFSNHQNYLMVLLVLIYIFIKTMPRLIIYGFIFLNLYGSVNLVRNWFPISAQLEQDLSTLELKDNAKLLVQRTLSWQYFFEGNKEKALNLNQSLIENNLDDADLLRENIIFKKN
jgi:cell division protein FtsW (lipid II flippase)